MTGTTSKQLTTDVSQAGDVLVVTLRGTFNSRVAAPDYQEAAHALRTAASSKKLVVNLVDIVAMDSKGEGEVEHALADVVAKEGRAAVVVDPQRRYLYIALEALVEELSEAVRVVLLADDALAFVRGSQ